MGWFSARLVNPCTGAHRSAPCQTCEAAATWPGLGAPWAAVADMADDGRGQAGGLDILLGADDQVGEPGDRDDGVGGDALVTGLERQGGPVGVVARLPEPVALGRVGRPLEAGCAIAGGDLLGERGL